MLHVRSVLPSLMKRLPLLVITVVAICPQATRAEIEHGQLFRIHLDGSGLEQLTHRLDWCFGSPDWSPDGRCIVADGWLVEEFKTKSYSATHLFIMNVDGSEVRDIGMGAMPSWSPDGT